MKNPRFYVCQSVSAFVICLFFSGLAFAQTSVFTYQGRFSDSTVAQPTNGAYDFQFTLGDALTAGTQQPQPTPITQTKTNVNVVNGVFSVNLDFGTSPFTGAARFLQIAVKKTTDTTYTPLTPRQELVSSPYSIKTLSATSADSLSSACVGCVTNAQVDSVAGTKITGSVANADNAATATNVSGTVGIANGGTGSATKNFVDLTTAQTVGGNKTFSNVVSANTLSAGSGGLNMNNNLLRLRDSADNNHGMLYNSTIDGPEFRAFGGFRWTNGNNGATERMKLDGSGNLTVNGNLTSTGTISGTLANNSVGGAQVVDGSLRLTDISIFGTTSSLGPFTVGANSCVGFNANLPSGTTAIGDILYVYFQNTTPAGFYVQPTITTSLTANAFYICNSLNTNNTFPLQTIRVSYVRP